MCQLLLQDDLQFSAESQKYALELEGLIAERCYLNFQSFVLGSGSLFLICLGTKILSES